MPRELIPTAEDWQKLLNGNPIAAEQLKNIILNRLLNEAEAKLAATQREAEEKEAAQEVPQG